MTRLKGRMAAAVFLAALVFLRAAGSAAAQGLEFSGSLDSTLTLGAGAGAGPGFFYGLEEYANIRMTAKLREGAAFYGALNLTALAGRPAETAAALGAGAAYPGLGPSPFAAGENYAAAVELERLYAKVSGEQADFQAGLMRMAFGYGLAFGPMDFLNPRNPLHPEARPRAVLGLDLAYYPAGDAKIQAFAAAGRNPLESSGAGALAGLAGEYHGGRLSVQGLYAYETPDGASDRGLHRFGLSLKGDLVLGLAAEALYTYNPLAANAGEGLALSLGLDYALLDGDLYVLAEYLYCGGPGRLGFAGNHYLYASGLYRLDSYTSLGLGCMAAPGDLSFTPVVTAEHELSQGLTLSLSCQIPLDRSLSGGPPGEFGPLPPGQTAGRRFQSALRARIRF